MDELTSGLDADALMDLDEAEGSDLDDEDEEFIDEPLPSPLQLPASGPGSTTTSIASSPPNNEDFLPPFHFSGKPLSSLKRGRGRPRREGGKPLPRRQGVGSRIRRIKPPGYGRGGGPRRFKSVDHRDFDLALSLSNDELTLLDPETGALIFSDKPSPILDEVPYAPESWPGKVCAFCNLGDRSQLGQAEILRLNCPEGFTPQRVSNDSASTSISLPERESGDKSPRGPVTCRRQKSFNKCRNPSLTSEYIDELTIIGHTEEPDVTILFESVGHFYVHRNCALWSNGVTRTENYGLENVGPVVLQSTSKKCSFCNHFGASVTCKMDGCSKIYHFPCATASGAFQELSTLTLFCTNHMNQASLCESSVCYTCKTLGDIANLMYCSSCGEHYHGTCVGLSQMPGVRAGWQCRKCRLCQICRMAGDETKLMNCEQCDKVYHASCQRPIVATIPKYGWKCRCCRVCGDCGSRTPGAGQSSRWHAHYTVCDSCYQQRNKGFCCPICHRAYRAHAHREMVQCSVCTKFVHGTCDPEADLTIYHQRKESHTDYEYTCSLCKNANQPGRHILLKRNSIEDGGDSLSASQESLYDETLEFETNYSDSTMRSMGLGKGKPFSACKIAKKRLGYVNNMPGRPKGWGKGLPGKVGFMKRQRLTEFGRKRGPKAKMRGMFGVPGVGLQRPVSDGKGDEEPGVENRLVLCSAKDKFVLTQDICVMCGSLGTDQEGCLISCVQCGQCYHPYCVNVKVTKVVLQKGWRCLDCTVCEGCGHRNDESRLILCDDCDISYHIYCMDPPLDYVPHGNWKCKWCAMCQSCGSTDPGFNCTWMNSFSECGPCASHNNCASCMEAYNEGDLIIQCVQCERWLHGICDLVKTEEDAERCAEEGYNCLLCRPRDVPPPHLIPSVTAPKPPTPTKSPEVKSSTNFVLDGIYLSESGHNLIKSLITEHHATRKKRKKLPTVQDKEAGIMATIESVVSGGNMENTLDDSARIELVDVKEEPQEIYKEGMMWAKEDGPPPEGFTIFTMENGISVLRRKRQRNLQKMGIGGFLVRVRGIRGGQENDDMDVLPGQTSAGFDSIPLPIDGEKPRRKPVRRKPKSKLAETFPPYLQEAFFGKELLDSSKELASSSSDEEKNNIDIDKSIHLSQDEIKAVAAVTIKKEKHSPLMEFKQHLGRNLHKLAPLVAKEEEEDDNTEELKDVLNLPGDLLDTDLVNTIMNEDDEELTKDAGSLEALASDSNLPDETDIGDTLGNPNNSKDTKDELSDILGSHFNLDAIPNINSKDVEDIFKGVLTDESQESQESNAYSLQSSNVFAQTTPQASLPQHAITTPPVRPTTLPAVNLNSPMSFPPPSPYQSEYSNSPQFSPAFSETANSWVTSVNDPGELDTTATTSVSTYNQRSSEKMKADEGLGSGATISAVLYANMNHPEWKADYPNWNDRYKQMIKKWRTLSSDQKAPYLQQARDNRSALRMKKQQQSQISKESSSTTTTTKVAGTPPAPLSLPSQIPAIATVSEVCTQQSRPAATLTTASTSSVSVSPPQRPSSVPPTLATHQQFTVHGPLLGPGDHCGPAPNVTVNPHYQPAIGEIPSSRYQVPPPIAPATDQQIRVLTPSEIMRTLPSLCQENYEPQPLDQEKVTLQQKSAREAEQERQWKQLQAVRHQQAQQQQHVIHEQRVQAISRVQRSNTDINEPFIQDLQVSTTPQELSPVTSPPSTPRQFHSLGIKSSSYTNQQSTIRPTTPAQTTLDFSPSAPDSNDPYSQQPATPKPQTSLFQTRIPIDPYMQPALSRTQFSLPRSNVQSLPVRQDTPENNNHLRDLLQRQQFKKLDEQLLAGKGQQRLWPPSENQDGEIPVSSSTTSSDATFRQPLPPPGITRPRLPVPISNVPRQMGALINLRMQPERLQGIDSRMRLLIQQQQQTKQRLIHPGTPNPQQQQQQTFQAGASVRFPSNSARPSTVDQYEQLLQRQQSIQNRAEDQQAVSHTPLIHGPMPPRQTMPQLTASASNTPSNIANDQEIPDNVTAELEKLERETGTMVELHGVSDILGGLGDDDDELLAEMGADFNILEYADPELEALAGEKTNILDLELEEEPMKKEKLIVPRTSLPQAPVTQTIIKRETAAPITSTPSSLSQTIVNNQPPPLAVSQPLNPVTPSQPSAPTLQQIHLQMIQQVQQAAAQNRPMLPGSKLQTVDGVTGIVTPNNNVQLHVPPNYQRILMSQLQHHKLQIRVGPQTIPRVMNVNSTTQQMHPGAVNLASPRMSTAPPPPPPPYPGPPPPYPGSSTSAQMGLRMGPEPPLPGHVHHLPIPSVPGHPQQRRPLLLEEQPLLLEDLLEQEKREQEKQNQSHITNNQDSIPSVANTESALLSDHDFERLKADVFNTSTMCISSSGQGSNTTVQNQWQQNQPCPVPVQPPPEAPPRVQLFNANLLPAPPLPPENIISEQDKQAQMIYEQWLNHQNNVLTQQLRYYETEVQKLRKIRKSLNSKQRQLRKSGNQLAEGDANELQRISSEQAVLQKHLETSRKQTRQHSMLMQEYRNKQAKQQPGQVSSPHISQGQSPLGPPGSSPIHHAGAAQSPMMSPSASPLTQHNSPLHSPGQIVTHSPGPNLLQSPSSSMAGSSMSPLQPSPRIGTPHSQNDSPVHSPSQICLPPPAPRMTSPQHRRIVTSPVAYSATGSGPGTPQLRFIRNPTDHSASLQQRVRLASPSGYPPKSGTPSPLNSPPQQQNITQQILQKQLHQHALMQQQHQQQSLDINQQNENSHAQFQRVTQLIKQRNIVRQAQQQQQQQQQQGLTQLSQQLGSLAQQQLGMSQQQLGGIAQQLGGITQQLGSIVQHGIAQPQPLTPQQHQLMIQQQQQLAKQQQQNFAQMQAQARLNQQQNNPPKSPMPPKSPLVQQILSPHSMPPSPMPPRSPMLGYGNQPQTPNSPVARSPVFHQSISQPPNSPMMHQSPSSMPRSPMLNQIQSPMSVRRPPSSPAIPDRPTSVENPRTPYTPESMLSGGGGNPNNSANPIPAPPCCGKFGYFKLGLRGGSPMWNVGKGTKRVPTPPTTSKEFDKTLMEQAMSQLPKIKKESHLSKVSILKKKSSPKIQSSVVGRINSLVSTDYNEFDDSSSTPPVTPPPMTSSSRIHIQKCKKLGDSQETKEGQVIVATPNEKHIRCDDIMDYDDDNHTLLSTVSLSSTAQNDCDDIAVIETLSQSDLTVVMSSPLEAGQISDEYLLFHGNITEEQYSDKEEVEGEYVSENMHIVIRSPTTSDDELIMQSKTKSYGMQDLTSEHVLSMTDTPDSPEQEEMNVDPSPESEETEINEVQGYGESEIVYLNPPIKISEEQISTKEDFEELIDEGSRKEKILKPAMINVSDLNDFHKYAASVYSVAQKTAIQVIQKPTTVTSTPRGQHKQQTTHKVMFSTPVIHNIAVSQADANKIPTTGNQPRTSVLTIPKLVSSGSPVITIVSGSSQINTILPSGFTVPVISASTVRQLTNVKVIDKPSSSLSLTTHDSCLPNKIFEDDSVSPDSSNCEDEKKDSSDEKSKSDSPSAESLKHPIFPTNEHDYRSNKAPRSNIESNKISRIKDELIKDLQSKDKFDVNSVLPIMNDGSTKEIVGVAKEYQGHRKENMKITSIITSESQRIPSPIISKASSPVIIHTTPELKMTAQVFQETQSRIQITARTESDSFEMNSSEDTKSVVISIPSPTPSQEQMLDNITLQALENRRRDGKGIPSGFESFEDVFDMIENITGETPTVLEDNIKDKIKLEDSDNSPKIPTEQIREREKVSLHMKREMHSHLPASVNFSKPSTMPQLSPLSQPTDLTTNVANATQQLRTLLSLHTTSSCSGINVESVVKSINNKITSTSVVVPASPIVTSRIIQHVGQPITTANLGTVIVPNLKTKSTASHLNNSIKATYSLPSSVVVTSNTVSNIHHIQTPVTIGFLPSRTVGGIQLMPDHPKLPPVTSVIATIQNSPIITQHTTNMAVHKTSVISTSTSNNQEVVNRKPSLTLTAMLQSHPAATPTTRSSVDTITAASILGTTIGLSRSGFSTSLVQAQPNVVISPTAVSTSSLQSNMSNKLALITSSSQTTNRTGSATNLLHTQLTKVMKNKPITELKNEMPKVEEIKHEPKEDIEDMNIVKQELSPCKSNIFQAQLLSRMEDSQNVLLKKLLQNTGCASTQSSISSSQSSITTAAPITTNVTSNIESQQSKAPPTLSSLLPTVIKTEPNSQSPQPKMHLPPQRLPLMSRETSFVSSPTVQIPQTTTTVVPSQQLHIDVKKCLPPSRTPSRDDLLSPQTPRSSCSQDSSLHTPPLIVKKEANHAVRQSPILTPQEVKKEFMDETSQHSEVSDHSRPDIQLKEEIDSLDVGNEKMMVDQKEELKKQKRRMYQQKRRQNQILNKETTVQPKKRPRKSSKVDEDYDTYIDSVLAQLRALPSMNVAEPILNRNFGVVPIFGSGDLNKLGNKEYDSRLGDLMGCYGDALVPDFLDFYDTKPFGDADPLPEKPPASTQRGFYDKEFPLIKFDNEEMKRFDLFSREDSPDSIISSSSPECPILESRREFMGLKLIDEDEDEEDEEDMLKARLSPLVPIITPTPIRLKPASANPSKKDNIDDKENNGRDVCLKPKFGSTQSSPLKDSGNVTVTLTLTSSAAEDIMGVLRDLANILHIPAPTSYQIVERTSTPPSQKLGLYRTKGKDGKEGAPIDIQSILNGAAKFCKHCDVVILNNMIKKRVSELPFLYKDSELVGDGDDLYFCSSTCYMQFALMHRSPLMSEDKAAAIIDHLCQKDKRDLKRRPENTEPKHTFMENMDIMNDIKSEMNIFDDKSLSMFNKPYETLKAKSYLDESSYPTKSWKNIKYKLWSYSCLQPPTRFKKPTDKETMELLYKLGVTVTSPKGAEDTRKCMFCQGIGDAVADGPGRLLNFDVDKWVHLNCGLWSEGVYETVNGALMNLENALRQSLITSCIHCHNLGATVRCFKTRCSSVYHLNCAVKDNCVFFKNKTTYCTFHIPKNEKDSELTTLSVSRRVYINRDENRQVAAVMHHSDTNNLLRVGSLIFLNVGQLLPHQLQNFHTPNYIYPIGYKIIRFYWSMRRLNKRCRYICSIQEVLGRPEFRVLVQESPEEDMEFKDSTPKGIWMRIVEQLATLRRESQCVQVFPKFVNGEDLFGLTEPAVVRVLESLPGIETLTDYKFKYGRNPLLELPLAINPSGAARTEPKLKNLLHWKRPHTQRSAGGSSLRPLFGPAPAGPTISTFSEVACPYSKQFVHSKSSQYKKMKQEWRNNVYLARSKIQGLGLYSARDLEKHTMVIEYIGELIRTELAETREKKYEARNRGIYMFRLDEDRVVDATLSGGLARYINHSCNPNCVAEIVEVDRDLRIIIFSKRRIQRGEELSYDYKFDIEDDQHKISCMCGAPNCRKWMN